MFKFSIFLSLTTINACASLHLMNLEFFSQNSGHRPAPSVAEKEAVVPVRIACLHWQDIVQVLIKVAHFCNLEMSLGTHILNTFLIKDWGFFSSKDNSSSSSISSCSFAVASPSAPDVTTHPHLLCSLLLPLSLHPSDDTRVQAALLSSPVLAAGLCLSICSFSLDSVMLRHPLCLQRCESVHAKCWQGLPWLSWLALRGQVAGWTGTPTEQGLPSRGTCPVKPGRHIVSCIVS